MPSLVRAAAGPPPWEVALALAGYALGKQAADDVVAPTPAYNLAGMLYLASNGWLLLSVPNALVRGVFAAMDEPGLELPPGPDGVLNAHISVMRPEELAGLGGVDKINERGKQFHYSIGRLVEVVPAGWSGVSRAWFLRVHSPELQALRRSYGLSSLPKEGKYDFHVTIGIVRRGVLARNDTSKSAA